MCVSCVFLDWLLLQKTNCRTILLSTFGSHESTHVLRLSTKYPLIYLTCHISGSSLCVYHWWCDNSRLLVLLGVSSVQIEIKKLITLASFCLHPVVWYFQNHIFLFICLLKLFSHNLQRMSLEFCPLINMTYWSDSVTYPRSQYYFWQAMSISGSLHLLGFLLSLFTISLCCSCGGLSPTWWS